MPKKQSGGSHKVPTDQEVAGSPPTIWNSMHQQTSGTAGPTRVIPSSQQQVWTEGAGHQLDQGGRQADSHLPITASSRWWGVVGGEGGPDSQAWCSQAESWGQLTPTNDPMLLPDPMHTPVQAKTMSCWGQPQPSPLPAQTLLGSSQRCRLWQHQGLMKPV